MAVDEATVKAPPAAPSATSEAPMVAPASDWHR
jgi:hypothetical protein